MGNRGQVGIGTLIVFIAMVLVAAIAAGVLINTAGNLQTQAEQTGEQVTQQVANNVNVLNEVGEVSDEEDTINRIKIGIQPSPGSGNINLEELSLQYVSDSSFGNFVHIKNVDIDSEENIVGQGVVFNTVTVTAENGGDNVMTDSSDRYTIVFPLEERFPFFDIDNDTPDDDLDGETVEDDQIVIGEETEEEVDGETLFNARFIVTLDSSIDASEISGFVEDAPYQDDSGSPSNQEDTILLSVFEGIDNSGINSLQERGEAELTITTASGSQTLVTVQAPATMAGDESGDTINI